MPLSSIAMARNHSNDNGTELTNDQLLNKAFNAANGRKFKLRFNNSYEDPALNRRYETRQQAEVALLANLAFWTGCDRERMWQLFQRSELYRPEEDQFPLYRQHLVDRAIEVIDDVYDPNSETQNT